MGEQPQARRRRWFQFSLRSLMVLVALAAGALLALRIFVEPYRLQDQAAADLEEMGATYTTQPGPAWITRFRGKDVQVVVSVDLSACDRPDEYLPLVRRLFGLETLVVGDARFTDEHLRGLAGMKALRALVLDSTRVSPAAAASLAQARPGLVVFQTQRRALAAMRKLDALVETEPVDVPAVIRPLLADEPEATGFRRLPPWTTEHGVAVVLDCRGAKLGDAELDLIATMPTLRWLRLAETPISGDRLKLLSDFDDLVWLDLSGTQIDDEALPYLRQLDRLETLWLHRTGVSDAGLPHLAALPRLKHLDLRRTRVSDAGLAALAEMKQLESLYVHWTAVTERGLADLQQCLPGAIMVR
jgi:hypothetical protein